MLFIEANCFITQLVVLKMSWKIVKYRSLITTSAYWFTAN